MPEIARGIVPAGKRLLPLIFLIAVGTPLAAKADNGIVGRPRAAAPGRRRRRFLAHTILQHELQRSDRGRGDVSRHQKAARRRRLGAIPAAAR